MKKIFIALSMLCGVAHAQVENRIKQYNFTEQLSVGRTGNNDPSAYFQIGPNSGGTKGMGMPRIANINSLVSPPINGLLIYDNSINRLRYKASDKWITIDSTGGGSMRYTASGVPSNSLGNNGDTYLDTATGREYRKEEDVWVLKYTPATGGGGNSGIPVFD